MKERIIILLMFAAVIFGLPLLSGARTGDSPQQPSADMKFPDEINLYLTQEDKIITVTAEEYLIGCISAQMPIDYEPEALKAQASASATLALRLMADLSGRDELPEGADISDSPRICQPYYSAEKREEEYGSDYEKFRENIEEAARYGISHIVTYSGEPIYAVYHALSAGRTCRPEYVWGVKLPYLKPVDSSWDTLYINYECVNEMTEAQARAALLQYNRELETPVDCARWFTDPVTDESGYVISVNIGKNVFSGGDIWRIFGLRSTAFTVSYNAGMFTFTTKGCGHGVGMSQYGANVLAQEGKDVYYILCYYYGDNINISET